MTTLTATTVRATGRALYPTAGPIGRFLINAMDTYAFCVVLFATEDRASLRRRCDTAMRMMDADLELRRMRSVAQALLVYAPELVLGCDGGAG